MAESSLSPEQLKNDQFKNDHLKKDQLKAILLEGIHASAVEAFGSDGHLAVDHQQTAPPEARLIELVRDVHLLGIRSATHLTRPVIEAAHHLIAIGCFCIGTNQVDLAAAQERGIPVFNAPFSNTRSVAELVLAEIVFLMRGIPQRNAAAHRGEWLKTATGSREARGKTLGIIGYGHIGTQVGVLAEALGMHVIFYDIEMKLALGNARQMAEIADLLAVSDIVTLHVPETTQTRHMMDAASIAKIKKGAGLINASRGHVVDLVALEKALEGEHLRGAALDVFPEEPKSNQDEFLSPLRRFDNVILTPHIGGSTQEAQRDIGIEVSSKLLKYNNNGSTLGAVNFPEVALPAHPGQHRLLHIHRNQPGVLSKVNAVFSAQHMNITGQYLQTNANIGYVVIDVEGKERTMSLAVKRKLEQVEGTIKTRILY